MLAFNNYQLILSLPELLTAFLTAVPLLLIDRSLAASRDLDVKLNLLSEVQNDFLLDANKGTTGLNYNKIIPHNLEWKLRAVDDITSRLLSRMSFINRVLTGMNEGVIVADTSNSVVFINDSFSRMFDMKAEMIVGQEFVGFLRSGNILDESELQQSIEKVLAGENCEKEFELGISDKRHYILRFSPVTANDDAGDSSEVIGILLLFSDVTKQRELDRLKAETVQLVSHELRAPLTSIQGLSEVLQKFPVSAEESQEMLATIHSEAVRLNELINRFLDIKRLESGVQDLQKSNFDLLKLINHSMSAANTIAAANQIKIELIEDNEPIFINADSQLLEQAIANLLNNAIKYSPSNTKVGIYVLKSNSALEIIIKDQGFGIPADSFVRIFDNFYRLERDAASTTVGTGLGLPFVKEVIEKHGGTITVDSQENIGSTFTINLPID